MQGKVRSKVDEALEEEGCPGAGISENGMDSTISYSDLKIRIVMMMPTFATEKNKIEASHFKNTLILVTKIQHTTRVGNRIIDKQLYDYFVQERFFNFYPKVFQQF